MEYVLERAALHKGTSFVEIYQNCNIFNDLAFEYATGKDTKADTTVYLEHNKPLIFGKEGNKGIRLNGLQPEIVTLGGEITEDDLLFHDEKAQEPSLAYVLTRMNYPDFPEPMGVFRCVERPTYEELVLGQIDKATKDRGDGTLDDLFAGTETWTVN